ncbi:MAG: hypothetical protein ACXWW0_03765 [Bacteroidia bacterium]
MEDLQNEWKPIGFNTNEVFDLNSEFEEAHLKFVDQVKSIINKGGGNQRIKVEIGPAGYTDMWLYFDGSHQPETT